MQNASRELAEAAGSRAGSLFQHRSPTAARALVHLPENCTGHAVHHVCSYEDLVKRSQSHHHAAACCFSAISTEPLSFTARLLHRPVKNMVWSN